jgi:enoyl-CoA hydratase/carnithine racemase
MDTFATLRYERHEQIGVLTLCRPGKHNAQNPAMWQELTRLGGELLADDTLRCLVVAGDGPSFSAGIDVVEGMSGIAAAAAGLASREDALRRGLELAGTFEWIPRLPCPSVAAVHGHGYGAGLQLALACDFRIFADSARVGLIETKYGLLPDMGATFRLPRIVGDGRARELILLGEVIDAAEALRIGLANRVVAADDLRAAALELAERLAAQPPIAVSGARRAIEAGWHREPAASLRAAVEEQLRCIASEDFAEGRQAMAQRRPPVWRGR